MTSTRTHRRLPQPIFAYVLVLSFRVSERILVSRLGAGQGSVAECSATIDGTFLLHVAQKTGSQQLRPDVARGEPMGLQLSCQVPVSDAKRSVTSERRLGIRIHSNDLLLGHIPAGEPSPVWGLLSGYKKGPLRQI